MENYEWNKTFIKMIDLSEEEKTSLLVRIASYFEMQVRHGEEFSQEQYRSVVKNFIKEKETKHELRSLAKTS